LTAGTTFLTSTFDATNCACDNIILEAHYNVIFDEIADSANAFVIKDITVDVVYGKTKLDACTIPKHYQLKTSLTYLQYDSINQLAYKYSGSPGYIKGHPILMATETTATQNNADGTTSSVSVFPFNQNGFAFRGADENGQCYWVGTSSTYVPPRTPLI
jgi:hypothetical protein